MVSTPFFQSHHLNIFYLFLVFIFLRDESKISIILNLFRKKEFRGSFKFIFIRAPAIRAFSIAALLKFSGSDQQESHFICFDLKIREKILQTLLKLSHFSRVRLCATPQMAAHQAPLSLGFSRQEHWSGLPFPSPMHESEK